MKIHSAHFHNFTQKRLLTILGLTVLGIVLFVWGNHLYTLYDNSETNYAAVAQAILRTGDWLTMHYNGQPWFVHPPLHFWVIVILTKLFGWSEFILRLPEASFGILTLILTYLMGRLFLSNRVSKWGAVILGTSFYFLVISRLAIFDTQFNFFMLLNIYLFFKAYYSPEKKGVYFSYYALASTLAVLTKGPFGLIQPGIVIVPFLIIKGNLNFLFDRRVWLNFLLFFVLTSPWYIHQLILHGEAFFNTALRDYTWYRFFGVVESQPGPWYYYAPVLLFFYPWILFAPAAVHYSYTFLRNTTEGKARDFIIFSWLFIVITLIFFSIAGTKLPNYIFLIFPFLSLLISQAVLSQKRDVYIIIGAGLTVCISLLLVFLSVKIPLPSPYSCHRNLLNYFALIPALYLIPASFLMVRQKKGLSLMVITIGTVILVLFLVHGFLPRMESYKESKTFVDILKSEPAPYQLVCYRTYSPYLMYYLNRRVIHMNTIEDLESFSDEQIQPVYVIFNTRDEDQLKKILSISESLSTSYSQSLYRIH